ncbi:YdcF family protein [uncultured Jannaschia sp.]|uniref:YdcF family protein n=1 Tax=uncultured Jannaschia sp. TaxID=293347 RepID=UPI002627DB55|nr:YdcF family protein [uncultured Jannaschia sp.]
MNEGDVETCAVVLGAAVAPDGSASPTLALRTAHAFALWRSGRVDRIVLTGGVGRHGAAEAVVAARLARAAGVPGAALVIEDRSATTFDNLRRALALVPPGAVIVLVSNRWHLPRAWLTLRLMGRRARVSGAVGRAPWRATLLAILREALATPLSAARALRWRVRR